LNEVNTVDDKDVALDPELLGRVFENLLASFNPETSTTARKATGSYYTPREIVHYMCQESLVNYLHTELNRTQRGPGAEQNSLLPQLVMKTGFKGRPGNPGP